MALRGGEVQVRSLEIAGRSTSSSSEAQQRSPPCAWASGMPRKLATARRPKPLRDRPRRTTHPGDPAPAGRVRPSMRLAKEIALPCQLSEHNSVSTVPATGMPSARICSMPMP